MTASDLRVALVHDWLTGMRGGEKVLEVLCELYPRATIFTLIHNKGSVSPSIESLPIRTSFIQHLPFKKDGYRNYLPLFPRAIESFDFSSFDLLFSTSHAVAKGALPSSGALHICYCHTPMRYVWELQDEYFGKGKTGMLTRIAMSYVAPRLRAWDVASSDRVHYFIANSQNVAGRIKAYYHRPAEVIPAPVNTSQFPLSRKNDGYYLIVSALVPYKRVDLAVETFNKMNKKLLVVGKGPELDRLRSLAGPNVEFLGWQGDRELARLYAGSKALVFPGVEDFGIVPLEAMSSGKPVVAYAAGGALETVIEGRTGVFFRDQSTESLHKALGRLERMKFDPKAIRSHAAGFDRAVFKKKIASFVEKKLKEHSRSGGTYKKTL